MVQKLKQLFLSALLLNLLGCATTIDYMVVGTGTHRDNKVHAGIIEFDNKWTAIGGIMTCCWEWATGTQGIYDTPPPKSVYVKWYDYEPGIYYEATLSLSENLYELATNIPPYHRGVEEVKSHPYLIIGFGENGEVVVWISNSARDGNKTGRVLHEVGRAQAKVVEKDTPRS
ncbi:DUF2931 family protein [Bermanella sp. R86510]|uniref:DUF2931 family protein n=1 Tax=unclassified Bermanella TaxID=2627862 RepID=UPI0037CC2713